ncbi:TIGR03899 family protein [Alteromonas australica]|uniref:TIGR03899 family protein n=1 Tax=Alteromonas australica TaxID=589873 RepID=UPI0035C7A9D5
MKITPDPYASQVTKPENSKTSEPTDEKEKTAKPTHHSANVSPVRRKILSWFSRVGISPSMSTLDPKREKQALERRKQILEIQKAANLQAVLNIALNVAITESQSDSLDPDWFFAFSSMAEEIYSQPMQELWGRIFAVEVSKPGSFSLRSLQLLKSLTHRDAQIFSKAVSMACRRQHDNVPRILVGYHKRRGVLSFLGPSAPQQINLAKMGLSYPDLLALQDMKLLYASEIESGEYEQGQQIFWRCGNESFTLEANRSGVALVYYKFTAVGSELAKLVSRKENSAYLPALKERLSNVFIVTE